MSNREIGRQLVVLDTVEQFEAYREPWQALEQAGTQSTFFQSYGWCGHVADMQARAFHGRYHPFACVGLDRGRVTAIWPLCRRRLLGLWSLQNLDDPFGQFAGILAESETAAVALVEQVVDYVRRERLADIALLERINRASWLFDALAPHHALFSDDVRAPFAETGRFATSDVLLASRNKKTRKNVRNAANRMARHGVAQNVVVRPGNGLNELIRTTLANRTSWLRENGLTSPPFRNAAHVDVLFGGEDWGLDQARVGFELQLNGRAIAQQWGFVHRNRYYAYMSGSDPKAALAGVSTGSVHLAQVMSTAIDEGFDRVEMLTPDSAYKMIWTDDAHRLVNASMALTTLGAARAGIVDRGLRPVAKAWFHAMPAKLRRRIVG